MTKHSMQRIITALLLVATFLPAAAAKAEGVSPDSIRRDLERGGEARRKAVWYIRQTGADDLLREAAPYLLSSHDVRDHVAILNVMRDYGYDLETHLPDWYVYLDNYISREIPGEPLQQCMDLAVFFKEHRLMPALSRLARHPDTSIRHSAFQAMSSMEDDTLIPVLLGLMNSTKPVERLYGLEGAARFEDYRLYPFIRKALNDPVKSVRIYAVRAFAAQNGLVQQQSQTLAHIFSTDDDAEVRESIIESFVKHDIRTQFPTLRQALVDSAPNVRIAALKAVRHMEDRRLASTISYQLERETEVELKRQEVETLLFLGESGGQSGLSHIVMNEPDASIRLKAVMAIHRARERGALEALVFAMKYDASEEVRLEAVYGVGLLGNRSHLEELAWVMNHSDDSYDVKSAALTSYLALGRSTDGEGLVADLPPSTDKLLKKQLEHLTSAVE